MSQKLKTIVLIDGENFLFKVNEICNPQNNKDFDISRIQLANLIKIISKGINNLLIKEIRFYVAKLRIHPETETKSKELIAKQRKLKNNLEKQGVNFVISGNVVGRRLKDGNKYKIVFTEKGVNVRLAVDMVSISFRHNYDQIIMCSSDSDLQPAVKECRNNKTKVVYLGFSINPNKGLMATCDQSVLFRNKEILSLFK